MGVNNRLERNALGGPLIVGHTVANQQGSLQVGALAQQILHQRIGLEQIPLVIRGAVPKSLQGIGNRHNRGVK